MSEKVPVRSPGKQFKPGNRHPRMPYSNKQGNAYYRRLEENVTYKIRIQNLPKDINEAGIRNLLTKGKPLSINYFSVTHIAFVTFKTYKEAELTVRDLNKTHLCNLKVDMCFKRWHRYDDPRRIKKPENEEKFFIYSNDLEEDSLNEVPFWKNDVKKEEIQNKLAFLINTLGYDPSIRMYQNWLDFRSGPHCISLGRGYTFMGDKDRFVGGLQAFHSGSEAFNLKDEIVFPCEYCKSLTVRICGRCEKPYCSITCLRNSRLNHEKDGCASRTKKGLKLCNYTEYLAANPVVKIDPLPLKPDCLVIITTYHTLRTLYVRQIGKPWDEKFCNLCNDVAAAALKAKSLKVPEVGLLCIARYYEDLCFYRAEVCSVEKEKVNVIFIDFGNCQETDIKDIREMPSQLKEERKLATKVELNDIPDGSSLTAVDYFNKLTAKSVPLIVKSMYPLNRVVLMEQDSNTNISKKIAELLKPTWINEPVKVASVNSGKPFYYDTLQIQGLENGGKYNFVISYFDEEDFDKTGIFWVVEKDSDSFLHVKYELKLRMMEWCNFLGNLPYLPRVRELCIAYEGGEWHRCVNLKSVKTTCFLFFVDDGQTAWVETRYIRKMERDFLEVVSQAISVKLSDHDKWEKKEENKLKVLDFLKDSVGKTIESVHVHKALDDYFIISIPKLGDMLK